jgi:cyanophycinase
VAVLRQGVTKGKEVDDGFGLLDPNWFVDQHFLTRGRFARALVIMQQFDIPYCLDAQLLDTKPQAG